MKESMHTMASKNSEANGSDRASAFRGKTPTTTPSSRLRWWFSETLNQRSVAQTCTPNSRRRKMDDDARPQPRSSTRMPGRKSSAVASHSVIHSELTPPLALAMTHSGWYFEERGNRSETSRVSKVILGFLPSSQCERSRASCATTQGGRNSAASYYSFGASFEIHPAEQVAITRVGTES